jgi:hypothetical protein
MVLLLRTNASATSGTLVKHWPEHAKEEPVVGSDAATCCCLFLSLRSHVLLFLAANSGHKKKAPLKASTTVEGLFDSEDDKDFDPKGVGDDDIDLEESNESRDEEVLKKASPPQKDTTKCFAKEAACKTAMEQQEDLAKQLSVMSISKTPYCMDALQVSIHYV